MMKAAQGPSDVPTRQAKLELLHSQTWKPPTTNGSTIFPLCLQASEYNLLHSQSQEAAEAARKQVAALEYDVRSLTDRLTDTQYR